MLSTSFINTSNVKYCKNQITLHYPDHRPGVQLGRKPVASWKLAYHALSCLLAVS